MNIVFVSNYINHHQLPFCRAMLNQNVGDFFFIQTEEMEAERVAMGWQVDIKEYSFVKCFYEEPEECKSLIMNSDVVIFGGTDDEKYIEPRLNAGKLVIRYSERIYKEGQWKFLTPRGLKKKFHDHIRYRKKDVYLLCAGAYVASDFHLIHAYPDKMFSWGYFPEFKEYRMDYLQDQKANEIPRILWAGRMIDWKHPEHAIHMAIKIAEEDRKNKKEMPSFHLHMIGNGDMENELKMMVKEARIDDYVTFEGFMNPEEVRNYMLQSDIFLFTSDFKEGWGAVLNESMNSGCAVVASAGIGAVPFLLQHEKNGLVYKTGDENELTELVKKLLDNKKYREILGLNAYETIRGRWNAENAATSLIRFIRSLQLGNPEAAVDGPMSKAPIISPKNGYKYTRR